MVEVLAELPKYVCRAGLKIEAALDSFGIDVHGRVCLDAGLSTGGFADCLLQRGAAVVYGVDVGYGQVWCGVGGGVGGVSCVDVYTLHVEMMGCVLLYNVTADPDMYHATVEPDMAYIQYSILTHIL